jgi:hypothetical protein
VQRNFECRHVDQIAKAEAFGFLEEWLTILFLSFGASIGSAQDRARVGWAAMTASHTPLWVVSI